MLNFTEGVIYGTDLIKNTTYMDSCVDIVRHNFIIKGEQFFNSTVSIKIFDALFDLYDMVWSVHPLLINCRQAPSNVTNVVSDRFNAVDDGKVMTVNLIQYYSDIVDSAKAVNDFFTSEDRGVGEEAPFEAGYGAGRIVYYIMQENLIYEQPRDPAENHDSPWE